MIGIDELLNGNVDNHILPFFWQHGEDETTLRHYMHVIHDANIGAVCVESRPHPDFAGPKWWADLDAILDEAQKLDMKVWILDDSHFPTGYANGALKNGPDSLCRSSIDHQTLTGLRGQVTIPAAQLQKAAPWQPSQLEKYIFKIGSAHIRTFTSPDVLLSVTAIPEEAQSSPRKVLDLTSQALSCLQAGRDLDFSLSDVGSWTVEIIHRTYKRGFHRDYINMMQAESVKVLIDKVYEPHWQHYQRYFGNTLVGFFSDEPEIGNGHNSGGLKVGECGDQAWSPEVEEELHKRWGDAFSANLAFIWNQPYDPDRGARIRFDYMDVLTRLIEKDFSFQVGDWCRRHGVLYIGHVIEDEHQHTRTQSSLGHYFRGLAGQDMSGVDDIGGQILPQGEDIGPGTLVHPVRDGEFWHYTLAKLAASSAALEPIKKGRAMCELYGAYGWGEGVRLEKYITDHLLVSGINWFVPHAFTPKAFPDPDCPPHFYAHGHNPQYRHFGALMKYLNRCADLISDGQAVIPAAILYNGESDWAGKIMYMQKPAIRLWDHQIDYLFVPNDALTGADPYTPYQTTIGKELQIGNQHFKCFIIPQVDYIPRAAAACALKMKKAGGLVLFIEALPKGTIEGGQADPLMAELSADFTPVGLDDLVGILQKNGIGDGTGDRIGDASLEPANGRIRIYHYRRVLHGTHQSDLYLIVNESTAVYNGILTVPASAADDVSSGDYAYYNAWSNRLTPARPLRASNGQGENTVSIPLRLQPLKSIFLLADTGERAQDQTDLDLTDLDSTDLDLTDLASLGLKKSDWSQGWIRSTCASLDYPAFTDPEPVDLPDRLAVEKPTFSGFVRYEKTLKVEDTPAQASMPRTILSISDAYEGVEVFVNGTSLGIQIVPEFTYDLTSYLHAGDNPITIEVATTLERQASTFPKTGFDIFAVKDAKSLPPSGINGRVTIYSD
jgi:hypothetical protein